MSNKIPYSLKGIRIKNFRGINAAELKALPKGAPWIFLTGRNGYGKTCLLQAIFLGLWGKATDEKVILEESEDFNVSLHAYTPSGLSDQSVKGVLNGNKIASEIPTAAYGPSRLSIQASASKSEEAKLSTTSYSLFNQDGVLLNIEEQLKNWYYRANSKELNDTQANQLRAKFQNVIKTILQILPYIANIQIDPRTDQVYYTEESQDGDPLPEKRTFEELAAGSKSLLAMVGDIIIRMFRRQENAINPSDLEGIVLIDELDLHLHPEWQYKLPSLLSKAFPKIQFIASTHSPIPLLGAPDNSLFLTVNRSKSEGITVKRLDIEVKNLNPNLILTSEIFGFYDIIALSNKDQQEVRTEDSMAEKEFRDELKRRLVKFAEEGGDYPDDLFK